MNPILQVLFAAVVFFGLLFLFAFVVKASFNASIAQMGTRVRELEYWQGFAFLVLLASLPIAMTLMLGALAIGFGLVAVPVTWLGNQISD